MKASDYRKRKAEREVTAEVTLPSGAVFTLRRPPLQLWIASGRIPQSFVTSLMDKVAGRKVAELSDADAMKTMIFLRDAVVYACVSPKLVADAVGEDELNPEELDPEDFEFLSKWVVNGSPGVPVPLKGGGETTVQSLDRFRQKRTGGVPFSLEPDGDEVRETTEQSARAG